MGPRVEPYGIHTSSACVGRAAMTLYASDSLGRECDVHDAWTVRGRTAGKGGAFLHGRLVAHGGRGVSVRALGGNRAGEMRIARFLHNRRVTAAAMMETALARTCDRVRGRHVLAIQDSSALRVDEKGVGVSLHPVLAVEAVTGQVLGLAGNEFLTRKGGARSMRKSRDFKDKDSRRWLTGAEAASRLAEAGAACVTSERLS